jgi:predicted transcriptional regulator
MKKPPTLKTAMTPFPYSVERDAPLEQARQLMDEHSVHHLPVTHERAVVGIISAHDMQSVVHSVAQSDEAGEFHVKDLYVSDPYVVDLNTRLDEVLLTLADRHIGSAIVMKGGKLAGMFTLVDACRCFGEYLREQFPPPGDDDAA